MSYNSLALNEPDSPESSSSLVLRDGEWQLPLDEDDMNYQAFKPKMASSPIPQSGNISNLCSTNFIKKFHKKMFLVKLIKFHIKNYIAQMISSSFLILIVILPTYQKLKNKILT